MKRIEEEERQKRRNEVTMESLKLIRKGKEKEAQTKRIEGIDRKERNERKESNERIYRGEMNERIGRKDVTSYIK